MFGTSGKHADDLMVGSNGRLAMNGRGIFNFSATTVPKCWGASLKVNGLTVESVGYIVLHQASRYIVDTIAARLQR